MKIIYLKITFDNKHTGDCPDEAAYNIINYFSVNHPNQDYQFLWNSDTEFITEKFIDKQINFNNNSIDIAILDTNNNVDEIISIIEKFVPGCIKITTPEEKILNNYKTLFDLVQSQEIDLIYELEKLTKYYNANIVYLNEKIDFLYLDFPLRGRTTSLTEFINLFLNPKLEKSLDDLTTFLIYSDFLYNIINFTDGIHDGYTNFYSDNNDHLVLQLIEDVLKYYNYSIVEDKTAKEQIFYRIRKTNQLVENLMPYFDDNININLINFNFYDNTWEQKSKYIEDLYKKFEEIRPKIRGTTKADELASIVNSYIRHPNVPDNQFLFDWADDYYDKDELMNKIYDLIIEVFYTYINMDFKKEIKNISKGNTK